MTERRPGKRPTGKFLELCFDGRVQPQACAVLVAKLRAVMAKRPRGFQSCCLLNGPAQSPLRLLPEPRLRRDGECALEAAIVASRLTTAAEAERQPHAEFSYSPVFKRRSSQLKYPSPISSTSPLSCQSFHHVRDACLNPDASLRGASKCQMQDRFVKALPNFQGNLQLSSQSGGKDQIVSYLHCCSRAGSPRGGRALCRGLAQSTESWEW